jgi:hypothetical protein
MKTLKIVFSMVLTLLWAAPLWAQVFSGPPSFVADVQDNPIDGGLSLLLGAGAVYGAKKIRDYRKSKKDMESKDME